METKTTDKNSEGSAGLAATHGSADNGGPAFAAMNETCGQDGMSLRDYIAAAAMQGELSTFVTDAMVQQAIGEAKANHSTVYELIAQRSYLMADAMLKARQNAEVSDQRDAGSLH